MSLKLSLNDDEFKNSFISGRFVIDCLEIKLTQNGLADPKVYVSPGYIQITPENGAEARLVCPRGKTDEYDPFESLRNLTSVQSGELFPESHYYRLEAKDLVGNVWIHPAVDLKKEQMQDADILTLSCDYIRTESTVDIASSFAHFIFLDELEFPKNIIQASNKLSRGQERQTIDRDASVGAIAGLKLTFDPRKNIPGEKFSEFFAKTVVDELQPLGFQDRLLESIRFCTATMTTPVMSETVNNKIRMVELSKARLPNKGIVNAPLSRLENSDDFYRLFECYFKYACENADGKDFAPISAKLGGLFTLKGVWLDTIVLLVGVAIEGLLSEDQFKKMGKPKKNLLDEIKKMIDLVKLAPVGERLKTRVINAVGGMKSNSASDRLHALVEAGVLNEEDHKTWKTLRNSSAHGSFEVAPEKMQKLLDDVYRLTTLIYKLVFMRIGYSGKYSNYAERGWNVAEFQSNVYQAQLDANETSKINVSESAVLVPNQS